MFSPTLPSLWPMVMPVKIGDRFYSERCAQKNFSAAIIFPNACGTRSRSTSG